MIRIMVTEAVQNILEHGAGKHVEVRFHINNDTVNPYMISSFKHEVPPGTKYTLSDINQNALRGDITSEYFDFESSRGRGEFIMKNLTDERRIINGIEVNREGQKVNYFRRILINYKNPQGARERVSFGEIKNEIDRLDYEDVVCCFHVQHHFDRPDSVTIATTKAHAPNVAQIMASQGFQLTEQEAYYRTIFATYSPPGATNKEQLLSLFSKVKQIVYQEVENTPVP
jgi:anti-sigma regulatory factor (Ser/Thr protein kinase)